MNEKQEKNMNEKINQIFKDFDMKEMNIKDIAELLYRFGFIAGCQAEVEIFIEKNGKTIDII